jgi:hypothetical protein
MVDVYLSADSRRRLIQNAGETLEELARARSYRREASGVSCFEAASYNAFAKFVKEYELPDCIGTCSHPVLEEEA